VLFVIVVNILRLFSRPNACTFEAHDFGNRISPEYLEDYASLHVEEEGNPSTFEESGRR